MSEQLPDKTLDWLFEATQAERQFAEAAPDLKDLANPSLAISLLRIPGEEGVVALFNFLTACVRYEEKVLEANPELALAGRERLERNLERLDKFFGELF